MKQTENIYFLSSKLLTVIRLEFQERFINKDIPSDVTPNTLEIN